MAALPVQPALRAGFPAPPTRPPNARSGTGPTFRYSAVPCSTFVVRFPQPASVTSRVRTFWCGGNQRATPLFYRSGSSCVKAAWPFSSRRTPNQLRRYNPHPTKQKAPRKTERFYYLGEEKSIFSLRSGQQTLPRHRLAGWGKDPGCQVIWDRKPRWWRWPCVARRQPFRRRPCRCRYGSAMHSGD